MDTHERLLAGFLSNHPSSAGAVLDRLPSSASAAVFEEIPEGAAASGLAAMSPARARDCVQAMSAPLAAALLSLTDTDAAAGLLRRLPVDARSAILAAMESRLSGPLERQLSYPEDTAGALVDPLPPMFPEDLTVEEALGKLREDPTGGYGQLYVIDRAGRLLGVVALGDLLAAPASATLAAMAKRHAPAIAPLAPLRAIGSHPAWSEYDQLPVVDRSGILVGVLWHQAVRLRQARTGGRTGEAGGLGTILGLGEVLWTGMYDVLEGAASGVEAGRRDPETSNEERSHD